MLTNLSLSLADLLGEDYLRAVCAARASLTGETQEELWRTATAPVDCYPPDFAARQEALMARVGQVVAPPFDDAEEGAGSRAFMKSQHMGASPLNGFGCFRVGEDGRLYFTGKSEHYQIPLGHAFPGYELLTHARRLGIPNATHNSTRGYITRLLERRLIAAANGLNPEDQALEAVLAAEKTGVLSRVLNLETGSLAVEAAMKMMLARFYPLEEGQEALYAGQIPVFLVMADHAGGLGGNYHGTTVLAQTLRGLWPSWTRKCQQDSLYRVVSVPINDADAFREAMVRWNSGAYKTAGFLHELILMNYGAIRLEESYLQAAYNLCRRYDTPTLCDEIQSCAWTGELFLFRTYGLKPDFVSVGKGFPGGEYPASRLLFSGAYDCMSQFGALVTNGQEELASLSYLITMAFVRHSAAHIQETALHYEQCLQALCNRHPDLCAGVTGEGHLSALVFHQVETAAQFSRILSGEMCVDASAQTYKPNCPPVVLTKLPLITTGSMVDQLVDRMEQAILCTEEV